MKNREIYQSYIEGVLRTTSCPERRRWAARELGKIWGQEAAEKLRKEIEQR